MVVLGTELGISIDGERVEEAAGKVIGIGPVFME